MEKRAFGVSTLFGAGLNLLLFTFGCYLPLRLHRRVSSDLVKVKYLDLARVHTVVSASVGLSGHWITFNLA